MRLFRFSARFAALLPFHREGLEAAIRGRAGMARLSRERLRAERLKLLVVAPHAAAVVRTMGDSGFPELLFGGMGYPAGSGVLSQSKRLAALEPDALPRLAALAVVIAEDADRLHERLRLAKAEWRRLASAASALTPIARNS